MVFVAKETAEARCCDVADCRESGDYPAPKKRQLPASYENRLEENKPEHQWFCLKHIREHNQRWNFFDGMSSEEIDAFQMDAMTGHRSTYKIASHITESAYQQAHQWYEFGDNPAAKAPPHPKGELDALQILGLNYPLTLGKIKARYRELVKRYHPDINGKKTEEKFKIINEAYHYLMQAV